MSWQQRDNRGGGGGRDYYHNNAGYRNVNHGGSGGLTITKNYNNNSGNRYGGDNRGNYNDRGRGNGWRGRGDSNWSGGRGRGRNFSDAPKKLPGNMMPRKEDPVPDSVKLAQQLLTRLADFSAMEENEDLYGNIKALAETVVSVGDLKVYPEEIAGLFVKAFSQLSVQAPVLASLLALVHAQEAEFAALVVQRLEQRLLSAVAQDEVPTAKLLLRSLACLTACDCFEATGSSGLLGALQGLLDLLVAGTSGSATALHLSAGAQASGYLLANTLLWAAPAVATLPEAAPLLSAAHAALQQVVAQWRSAYSVGGLQAVFNAFAPTAAEEGAVLSVGPSVLAARGVVVAADGSAWDSLWESAAAACALLDELKAGAAAGTVYTYPAYMNAHWVALKAESLLPGGNAMISFSAQFAQDWAEHLRGLGGKAQHCTPTGALSSVLGSSAASSWLRARFVVFDAETSDDCAACCALPAHAKHMARSYLEDVLTFFDPVVNEDGTKLGSVELQAAHLLAAFKLFPGDCHVEYLLVEALFQLLLQPPVNTALSASVFRLVLELCRRGPQVFPPVVALGANTVFQLVPDLDAGAALEFGRWFTFHLINTQLSWPEHYWEFWVSEVEEAEQAGLGAVPLFVRAVVERLSAAVIPDKLKQALPQALHRMIPPALPARCALLAGADADASSASSMLMDLPGIMELASQLKAQIEAKADPEDVTDWLEAQSLGEGAGSGVCWRGCMLLQVLLHVANAGNETSLSAAVGMLDRYSEGLLVHASTDLDHANLLAMLREVYGGNQYMYQYVLDEMLRRGQISVTAAATALCGSDAAGRARWLAEPSVHSSVTSVLERAVDFVKAAVALRSQLGGAFCLDETADLTPTPAPQDANPTGAAAPRKRAARPVDDLEGGDADGDEVEGEEDGDDGDRRKRSRHDEGDADNAQMSQEDAARMEDGAGAEAESEEDPLWAAEESLKSALRNSRAVFAQLGGAFRQAIASPVAEDGADAAFVAASLLRRTWRLYVGTERHLTHQQQARAVLSAPEAQRSALLYGLGAQAAVAGVDVHRWLSQ